MVSARWLFAIALLFSSSSLLFFLVLIFLTHSIRLSVCLSLCMSCHKLCISQWGLSRAAFQHRRLLLLQFFSFWYVGRLVGYSKLLLSFFFFPSSIFLVAVAHERIKNRPLLFIYFFSKREKCQRLFHLTGKISRGAVALVTHTKIPGLLICQPMKRESKMDDRPAGRDNRCLARWPSSLTIAQDLRT